MAQPVNTFQPRNNSGAIFRNDRKEKPTHADMNGECVIEGREYYISGWTRESKNGRKYLSLAFKAKPKKTTAGLPPQRAPGEDDDKGEDMPW